jgi:hypothetical protein
MRQQKVRRQKACPQKGPRLGKTLGRAFGDKGLGACGRHGPRHCRAEQPRRRRPTKVRGPVFIAALAGAAGRAFIRCRDGRTAVGASSAQPRRRSRQACNAAQRARSRDARHERRDQTAEIEAAKSEAIKTAKQAPPWPESAPPVPMTLADVAVMVKTVSPAPAGAAEPPSPSVATSATNTDEHAPPDTTASLEQAYGAISAPRRR